jgi:hypothetical protein
MGHNISRMKSSNERTLKKQKEVMLQTELEKQARCRRDIQKHHEDLKDDPERLTTDFLVKICGCKCKQYEEDDNEEEFDEVP